MRIDYYLSVLSPWCYLAGDRLERIAAARGARIDYRPLDTLQLFDRIGSPRPEARSQGRKDYRAQELPRWAARLGMPLALTPRVGRPNQAPASYAIIAAQAEGGDVGPLVQSILRAYWAEERDIADDAVLAELLEQAGFDPALTTRGMFTGAEAYARNLDRAVDAGVFGVPFYIVAETDQRFWGQDRLDFLDAALAG